MKRIIYVLAGLVLVLCCCSKPESSDQFNINEFSYKTDCSYYENDPGVKLSGFINTEKCELKTAEEAVELAKKECVVEYDTINVAFDATMKIYKVSFSKENFLGGNQDVYIGQDGITLRIVFGE